MYGREAVEGLGTYKVEKSECEKLVDEHWNFIYKMLVAHEEDEKVINRIKFHWRTAFIHGWKHRKEYEESNGNNRS